jgi:hypothetical protein
VKSSFVTFWSRCRSGRTIYQRGRLVLYDDLHCPPGNSCTTSYDITTMTVGNAWAWLCTTEVLTPTASTFIILLRVYVRRVRLGRWDWSDWMNGMYSPKASISERLQYDVGTDTGRQSFHTYGSTACVHLLWWTGQLTI